MSNIYASSFPNRPRHSAILSGLPAAPDEPVMKHTAVAEAPPGLPAALAPAGYRSIYYYGGDINFTNPPPPPRQRRNIERDPDLPPPQKRGGGPWVFFRRAFYAGEQSH